MGEYKNAEVTIYKAISLGGKYWDENHANMRTFKSTLCDILINQRRYLETEPILVKLINYREAANDGALSIKSIEQHLDLALVFGETGRKHLAVNVLNILLFKINRDNLGAESTQVFVKINSLMNKYIIK